MRNGDGNYRYCGSEGTNVFVHPHRTTEDVSAESSKQSVVNSVLSVRSNMGRPSLELSVNPYGTPETPQLRRRECAGGFIYFPPAPPGLIIITGADSDDKFVAEYKCLTEDFSVTLVHRMERVVASKALRRLQVV
jgi:hypothetical protein